MGKLHSHDRVLMMGQSFAESSMHNSTDSIPPLLDHPYPDDTLPPPYSEHDIHQNHPGSTNSGQTLECDASGSKVLQSATIKFPPAMNGYFNWKSTTTFHLGPTAEEKLFAVSLPAGLFNSKPSIILHDGPTNKHPALVTSRSDKWGRLKPIEITLCPRPGNSRSSDSTEHLIPSSTSRTSAAFTFEVNTDCKGTERERFEWRSSHGNEIKQLATGHSYGWKLVRLTGPVHGAGGSRKDRDVGISSDRREIVAVMAHNASMSMNKGFRFVFFGTGLTGTLGEDWEVMTVVSAMQFWYLDTVGVSTVGAASASSSTVTV